MISFTLQKGVPKNRKFFVHFLGTPFNQGTNGRLYAVVG